MDIRKNEHSAGRMFFYLAVAALVFVGRLRLSWAETQTPAAVLTATYSLPLTISAAEAESQFVNGSVDAPALAIGHVKNSKAENQAQELISALERLSQEHPGACGEILLQYHHAWLLDALGSKDEALEIFTRICSADVVDAADKSPKSLVLKSIAEYARIQSAIMLGEKADYTEALRVLGTLGKDSVQSHISVLAGSVREGLQILRREVPGNEN